MNIIFYDYTGEYEKKYFGSHWISLDDGRFWREYTGLRQLIVKSVEEAKINEAMDSEIAFENYQNAYVAQEKVYEILGEKSPFLKLNYRKKMFNAVKTNKNWFWATVALTLLSALIWEACLRLYYIIAG